MFFTKHTYSDAFEQSLRYRIHGIPLQLHKPNTPSLNKSTSLGVKLTTVGLFGLTMANVGGALWANDAWGGLWTWDPKEIGSALVWCLTCIYLHGGIRYPKRSLRLARAGLSAVWLCYFGVNFFAAGQHVYGLA